jgi:phytol kinase
VCWSCGRSDDVSNALAIAVFSLVFIGLLAVSEWLHRRWRLEPEHARKFAHVTCGLVAAALPFFMGFRSVAVLSLLFIPFMVLSRRLGIFPSVHRAERSTLGDVYFPLGVLIVASAFPDRAPYMFGVLVMALSDAAAGVIGKRFGRRGYRIFGAWKTYVGSGAFFGATLAIAVATLSFSGTGLQVILVPAIVLATGLTIVEGAFGGGADNVVLPGVSAGLLVLLT